MLGIIRNDDISPIGTLKYLHERLFRVFTFGRYSLFRRKINRSYWGFIIPLIDLGNDIVVIFSLGYLTTDWIEKYCDVRDN